MDNQKILLLSQLVDGLSEVKIKLEEAYNSQDKKRFDQGKEAILDFQKKIDYLLKEK